MPLRTKIAEAEAEGFAQAAREVIDAWLSLVPDANFRETFWSLVAKAYAYPDEEEVPQIRTIGLPDKNSAVSARAFTLAIDHW